MIGTTAPRRALHQHRLAGRQADVEQQHVGGPVFRGGQGVAAVGGETAVDAAAAQAAESCSRSAGWSSTIGTLWAEAAGRWAALKNRKRGTAGAVRRLRRWNYSNDREKSVLSESI